MLPHTGLFLLWKVALQMRIRRRLKPNTIMKKTGKLLPTPASLAYPLLCYSQLK